MSATRDQSQKFTFVYSNLYHLYKKGKDAAVAADVPSAAPVAIAKPLVSDETRTEMTRGVLTGRIIKADDLREMPKITRHEPPRFITKRIEANRPMKMNVDRERAVSGLRDNLKQLKTLQERLHFMLKEIEEFTKE
jgi:hypothetical protein